MKRRQWLRWAGSVALMIVLTSASTTSCSTPPDELACDKAPFSLDAKTYADVGNPGKAEGSSEPHAIVLDEKHSSRVGQVEIAIMLNRLYHSAGLRHLGLEGNVVEEPESDLSWFTSLPDANIRTAVALQSLRQGEVSAAEFAAMVLPGFQVHAIERNTEYQVDLPAAAGQSYNGYLVAIALMGTTADEMAEANALLDQNKYEEAIRHIVGTDPWTLSWYETLERTTPVLTVEEMRNLGLEIERRANEVARTSPATAATSSRHRRSSTRPRGGARRWSRTQRTSPHRRVSARRSP